VKITNGEVEIVITKEEFRMGKGQEFVRNLQREERRIIEAREAEAKKLA
jgi:hypothetical protein